MLLSMGKNLKVKISCYSSYVVVQFYLITEQAIFVQQKELINFVIRFRELCINKGNKESHSCSIKQAKHTKSFTEKHVEINVSN